MLNIRVGCLVVCGEELALIHRFKAGKDQWTLPGGNLGQEEDIESAIVREFKEELNISRPKTFGI